MEAIAEGKRVLAEALAKIPPQKPTLHIEPTHDEVIAQARERLDIERALADEMKAKQAQGGEFSV